MTQKKMLCSYDAIKLMKENSEIQANYHFCNCLKMIARYLTGNDDYDFLHFAGITGSLVGCYWTYQVHWDTIGAEFAYNDFRGHDFPGSNEILSSVYQSFGYSCEILCQNQLKKNPEMVLKTICNSIDNGYPVLSFGLLDTVGEVIVGYDSLHNLYAYNGCNADKCDKIQEPLSRLISCVIITGKLNALNKTQIAYTSLKNMKTVFNIPSTEEYAFAEDAYDAWANELATFDANKYIGKDFGDYHASLKVTILTGIYHISYFFDRISPYVGLSLIHISVMAPNGPII